MRQRSLVPDTNVWAYLVEADAVERVRIAARDAKVNVVACPAVLYECLRVKQPKLRKARMTALTRQSWSRPMPEAFLEAEDLRAEITRARPHWLAGVPNLAKWRKLQADWQHGTWRRARTQIEFMARAIDERRPSELDRARAESKAARRQAQELGHTISSLRLDRAEAWYPHPVPGWDGEKFEAWRAGGEARWWRDLVGTPHPAMLDWLGPWLDLDYIQTHHAE